MRLIRFRGAIMVTSLLAAVTIAASLSATIYRYIQSQVAQRDASSGLALFCPVPKNTGEEIYFVSCGGFF